MSMTPEDFLAEVAIEHLNSNASRSPQLAYRYNTEFASTPKSVWLNMQASGAFTPASAYSEWVCEVGSSLRHRILTGVNDKLLRQIQRVKARQETVDERKRLIALVRPDAPAKVPVPKAMRPDLTPWEKFSGGRLHNTTTNPHN